MIPVPNTKFLFAALSTFSAATVASAQPHVGDVFLAVEGGRIVSGLIPEGGGLAEIPHRVFRSDLGEIDPNFSDEPGFDNLPGTFSPSSALGVRLRGPLRVWNGGDFSTIAESRMTVAFSTLSIETPPDDRIVQGFTLPVGSNGEWHRHLEYTLQAPATDGVYLLELDVFSTDPAIGTCDPLWLVFNQHAAERDVQAALAWTSCTLAGECVCDPDANQDGNVDQGDVDYLVNVIAGGSNPAVFDPDFNRDGNVDQGDVSSLLDVVAGGACP